MASGDIEGSKSLTHSLTDALDQQRVVAIPKPTGLERRRRQRWQVVQDPLPVAAATSVLVDLGVASTHPPDERQPDITRHNYYYATHKSFVYICVYMTDF